MRRRDHFEWVVIRLEYWGRWTAEGVQGLDFPGRTNEGRLMDDGQIGLVTNYRDHSPHIEFAHKEQETDRAVSRLPMTLGRIIHLWYVDNKRPEDIAKEMSEPKSSAWVRRRHDMALGFLAAAITDERIAQRGKESGGKISVESA